MNTSPENEILTEIHRIRAEHAAECGHDPKALFAQLDEETERLRRQGWKVVALEPKPIEAEEPMFLRDEPPKP